MSCRTELSEPTKPREHRRQVLNFWGWGFAQVWRRCFLCFFLASIFQTNRMFKPVFCADFGAQIFAPIFGAQIFAPILRRFLVHRFLRPFCAHFRAHFSSTFWSEESPRTVWRGCCQFQLRTQIINGIAKGCKKPQ